MYSVGITGGMGSGKTTFCSTWERLGAKVVYADQIARELMEHDPGVRNAVIQAFGEESYTKQGLNKEWISRKAFKEGMVKTLNACVHPAVFRRIEEEKVQAEKEGYPLFGAEAALLLDQGRPAVLDVVIVIAASESKRVKRIQIRDGHDEKEIVQRMRTQMSQDKMILKADRVIYNDGTVEELEKKAGDIFSELSKGR
ncbi:dephospho-CoA kinase [Balneolaceae bacterium ANBcel3]|nr:dephospho-CoA kinase [Balneolaceae bacterium ANBcel3]